MVPQTGEKRVKFGYDYQGRRVRKTVEEYDPNAGWTPAADTAYVWDGWKLLLEIDLRDPNDPNDDFIPWKYTWGLDLAGQNGQVNSLEGAGTIGGLLAMQDMDDPNDPSDPNDATGRFACFYDGNGNLTQLLHLGTWDPNNPEVAIRAHYEYDPYGNVVRQTGDYAAASPWRISTKQFDAETGLGYWGYRYYSPALGRWVSRDPIEEVGGANLQVFVANAPLTYMDALGLKWKKWSDSGFWAFTESVYNRDRKGERYKMTYTVSIMWDCVDGTPKVKGYSVSGNLQARLDSKGLSVGLFGMTVSHRVEIPTTEFYIESRGCPPGKCGRQLLLQFPVVWVTRASIGFNPGLLVLSFDIGASLGGEVDTARKLYRVVIDCCSDSASKPSPGSIDMHKVWSWIDRDGGLYERYDFDHGNWPHKKEQAQRPLPFDPFPPAPVIKAP